MNPDANNAAADTPTNGTPPVNPAGNVPTNQDAGTQTAGGEGQQTPGSGASDGGLPPELSEYIKGQGGIEKIVEAHKNFRVQNAQGKAPDPTQTQDPYANIVNAQQAEGKVDEGQAQPAQQKPQDNTPAPIQEGYLSPTQMAAFGLLNAMATSYPEIAPKLQDASILKEIQQTFKVPVFDKAGNLNYELVNTYARQQNELASATKAAESAPVSKQPEAKAQSLSDLEKLPSGSMDRNAAMNIVVASQAAAKRGDAQHPDYERAINFLKTGKDQ